MQLLPLLLHGTVINHAGSDIIPRSLSRFRADIDKVECNGCGSCHGRCNFGAIGWEDGEGSTAVIHAEKCNGVRLVPVPMSLNAIKMIEFRPKDFIPKTGASIFTSPGGPNGPNK